MGVFKWRTCRGHKSGGKALARRTLTIIGGGDSAAAVAQLDMQTR